MFRWHIKHDVDLAFFLHTLAGVTWCILSLIGFPSNRLRVRVILPVPGTRRGILRCLSSAIFLAERQATPF